MSDRQLLAFTDYTPETLSLLIAQYANSPRLRGILDTMNNRADSVEKAVFEIRDLMWLSTATGYQLDILGSIYGVKRDGRTDAAYRQAIRFRSQIGYSATPEELIGVITEGFGASFVEYVPEWIEDAVPAQYVVRTDIGLDVETLQNLSPAGVLGLQGFFLVDALGHPILWQEEDPAKLHRIMFVGVGDVNFPLDNTWDGGVGAINPDEFKIKEPWPFRDGNGVGEFPDGGVGLIVPENNTFLDGSYAVDPGA